MGNKSRFRFAVDAQGNRVKVKWRNVRDLAKARQPKSTREWKGIGATCAADLVHVRVTERIAADSDPINHQHHYRRALPVLWNSSKAGTFRRRAALNSQTGV